MDDKLSVQEIGLIRWYRGLDDRIKQAINIWLLTGDKTLLEYSVTHHRHQVAA